MAIGVIGQHSLNVLAPVEKGPCNVHDNVTTLLPPMEECLAKDQTQRRRAVTKDHVQVWCLWFRI